MRMVPVNFGDIQLQTVNNSTFKVTITPNGNHLFDGDNAEIPHPERMSRQIRNLTDPDKFTKLWQYAALGDSMPTTETLIRRAPGLLSLQHVEAKRLSALLEKPQASNLKIQAGGQQDANPFIELTFENIVLSANERRAASASSHS